MSEPNGESLEDFESQLCNMVTPSSVERSEELFYELGWAAAFASQKNAAKRPNVNVRPLMTGLAIGAAAMLGLLFGFWRIGIEQGANSSVIVNEISPSELLPSGIDAIANTANTKTFDDSEFLIALVPPYASHGVQLVSRSNAEHHGSDSKLYVPNNQSTQSFRQEILEEIQ
jgi:hypothetical protein